MSVDELTGALAALSMAAPPDRRAFDSSEAYGAALRRAVSEAAAPLLKQASCGRCGRGGALKACACRAARYCSVACQKRDWPRHKLDCRLSKDRRLPERASG